MDWDTIDMYSIDLSLNKRGLKFFGGSSDIFVELKLCLEVNANTSWLIMFVGQYSEIDC